MMKFCPIFLLVVLAICQWGYAETISSPDTEGSPASAAEKENFVARPIEEIEELFHQKQCHILIENYDDLHKDFCRSIFQNRQSFVGTGFQPVLAHRAGFAPLYELSKGSECSTA